jgi:type I restriction enzyme S subunit
MKVPRVPLQRLVLDACDGPFGSALKTEHYSESGARVVRLANIGSARWNDSDRAYVPIEYWSTLPRHHAAPGDVLVAGLGDDNNPVGRACVVPNLGPAMVKADCYRLRLEPRLAQPEFIAFYLSSPEGLEASGQMADGATRSRLTLGKALSIPVPFLPLEEQAALAAVLRRETTAMDVFTDRSQKLIALVHEEIDAAILEIIGDSPIVAAHPTISVEPLRRLLVKVNRSAGTDQMVTAFRDGQVTARSLRRMEGFTEAWTEGGFVQGVHEGDVVIHGLDGFAGAVGVSEAEGVCSPVYHVCVPAGKGDAHFYGRLLRVLATTGYLSNFATSTRERAVDLRNWDLLGSIPIPSVAPSTQRDIGDRIRQLAPLRGLIDRSGEVVAERRVAALRRAFDSLDPASSAI